MRRSAAPSARRLPVVPLAAPLSQHQQQQQQQQKVDENASPKVMEKEQKKKTYFNVVWRPFTRKKHPSWAGDAILVVHGAACTLVDMEGKTIGSNSSYSLQEMQSLTEGEQLQISGKEIEIMSALSAAEFESGQCFLSGTLRSTKSATTNAATPARPASSGRKPLRKKDNNNDDDDQTDVQNVSQILAQTPVLKHGNMDSAPGRQQATAQRAPARNLDGAYLLPKASAEYARAYRTGSGQPTPVINDVYIDFYVARSMRVHQKEGVKFLYECVMGMKEFVGNGAILADEMGLGKTLQAIGLIWTLLKQSPCGSSPVIKRALIVCPASLIVNWQNEFKKWLGDERLRTFALLPSSNVDDFVSAQKIYPVIIISYEKLRLVIDKLKNANIGLIIADEGHRLKNFNVKTAQAIRQFPTKRRVILTGTPIQNDLGEFFSMVDFTNPGILGTYATFRQAFETPILQSRQKGCSKEIEQLGQQRANELSRRTSLFVLRRTAVVNEKYLPPKIEMVVFCRPTELQCDIYDVVLRSKTLRQIFANLTRSSPHFMCITMLRLLCNAPYLIYSACKSRRTTMMDDEENQEDEADTEELSGLYDEVYSGFPTEIKEDPNYLLEHFESGKLEVLENLLDSVRAHTKEKVVLVSNFTKTLDVFEHLLKKKQFPFLRLDGSTPISKRQSLVDRFNRPTDPSFVFLLSGKSGGQGLNLIGASRIVLYDIDWNPAVDQQSQARIWRDGQKKTVFIYRFLTTGTIEEKIYQRQATKLALKENIMDDRHGKMMFSLEDLRDLFTLEEETNCSTHDLLNCRCHESEDADEEPPVTKRARTHRRQMSSKANPFEWSKRTAASHHLAIDDFRNWSHFQSGCSLPETICGTSTNDGLAKLIKEGVVTFMFQRIHNSNSTTDATATTATTTTATVEEMAVENTELNLLTATEHRPTEEEQQECEPEEPANDEDDLGLEIPETETDDWLQ